MAPHRSHLAALGGAVGRRRGGAAHPGAAPGAGRRRSGRPRPWPVTAPQAGSAVGRAAVLLVVLVLVVALGSVAIGAGVVGHGARTGSPDPAEPAAASTGTVVAAAGRSRATVRPPAGGSSEATPPVAVPEFRSLPLPRLLPRDAVGPLWLTPQDRAAGVLALGVPRSASGVLDVVPGAEPAPRAGTARAVRVEVERGLPVDPAAFAATVMATLNDPRGWGARGDVSFARTDGPADVRVVLASPDLVDALCAPLPTGGEVSCGRNGHAALNARRWVEATPEFADRTQYRHYLVNHEVGHLLGHPHERCPGPGRLAPIMQQQSLRVAPCLPNGWPHPAG